MSDIPKTLEINGQTYSRVDCYHLARMFADWPSDQQAIFINHVATESAGWAKGRFSQWVAVNDFLTDEGRKLVKEWAEYFEKQS